MEKNGILETVLHSFERYYNVKAGEPGTDAYSKFKAEAEFHSHSEQYFLTRAAHIADIDSHEYVFFAEEDNLTSDRLAELESEAWKEGLARVHPGPGHRNSDVALIIIADNIEETAFRQVSKIKRSKSYRFSLHGWSNFRLLTYEVSSGRVACNRAGKSLKKVISTL